MGETGVKIRLSFDDRSSRSYLYAPDLLPPCYSVSKLMDRISKLMIIWMLSLLISTQA